ncbi:hypothetical protein [Arthrobacter sp. MYb221]|uniref:hypothetical protein n=1 Tax=Arthrobacter sp. MYb221 TaxID=1848598 RepID=UPI0011B0024B|nr:hypothetical protein [Arthrobacter sp. MYb221]
MAIALTGLVIALTNFFAFINSIAWVASSRLYAGPVKAEYKQNMAMRFIEETKGQRVGKVFAMLVFLVLSSGGIFWVLSLAVSQQNL